MTSCTKLVSDFVMHHLIDYIGKRIRILHTQVVTTRKGFANSIKKLFGTRKPRQSYRPNANSTNNKLCVVKCSVNSIWMGYAFFLVHQNRKYVN